MSAPNPPAAAFLPALAQAGADVRVAVKAVPGASRSKVAGMLGDRLKIAVAAPPEDGKANKALCALLADTLGASPKAVEVVAGQTNPRKTVQVAGMTVAQVAAKLAQA